MAFIVCPECRKKVSDQANACPHCGCPISMYAAEFAHPVEESTDETKFMESVSDSDETKPEKAPMSAKTKRLIAVFAAAYIVILGAVYVFAIKLPRDRARAAYEAAVAEYENAVAQYDAVMAAYDHAVGEYEAVAYRIIQTNEELTSAISALHDLVYSGNIPYDISTREAAVDMIAEAKAVNLETPDTLTNRYAGIILEYTVFQSAEVLAEAEEIRQETETVVAATENLIVPDYAPLLEKMENIRKSLADSILQNRQVTNPSEAFVMERLAGLPGIVTIEAATEDNDPNGQLHKTGGYTAAVFFIYDQVTDSYVLNKKGSTPVERGTDGGGCIEVYQTAELAEARNAYLAMFDGTVLSSGSHTVCGSMVIRTSAKLTAAQQMELEERIIAAFLELA